jgi:hypothetical protein
LTILTLWSTYGKFIVLLAWKDCTTLVHTVFVKMSKGIFFCWNMEIDSFPVFHAGFINSSVSLLKDLSIRKLHAF